MANLSGFVYSLGGIIIFYLTYRLWKSYQRTRNLVTRDFAYTGTFITLALFIFGLSSFILSRDYQLLKIGGLFAITPLFIASAFGLRIFFYSKLKKIPPNLSFPLAIFLGAIMLFLQATYIGHPQVIQGIVDWNIQPTAFLLFTIVVLVFTIPLTIIFIQAGLRDPRIQARSFSMAAGFFLAGIGSILNSSNFGWLIIVLGAILMALGFGSLVFAFFFAKPSFD